MISTGLLLRAFGLALVAMIANVAAAFAWVWFYSEAIAPGRAMADYEAYAQSAAPVSSIVAGIPILFAAGYWIARRQPAAVAVRAAVAVALCYLAIDLTILLLVASPATPWGLVAISFATKLLAAYAGGRFAARRLESVRMPPI